MKKLTLRAEHLGELSPAELRQVAGAAGEGHDWTISDGSCVCAYDPNAYLYIPKCDISDGSCVCTGTR